MTTALSFRQVLADLGTAVKPPLVPKIESRARTKEGREEGGGEGVSGTSHSFASQVAGEGLSNRWVESIPLD